MQYSLVFAVAFVVLVFMAFKMIAIRRNRRFFEGDPDFTSLNELGLLGGQINSVRRCLKKISDVSKIDENVLMKINFQQFKEMYVFSDHAYDDISELLGYELAEKASDEDMMIDLIMEKVKQDVSP